MIAEKSDLQYKGYAGSSRFQTEVLIHPATRRVSSDMEKASSSSHGRRPFMINRRTLVKISFLNLLGFLLALAIPPCLFAEDLLATYERAAATNPTVAKAAALLKADRAGESIARSALLPKVGGNAGVSGNNADISGFGEDFMGGGSLPGFAGEINKDFWGANYSVMLTQPIVNGQAWVALRSSRTQIRAGEAGVAAAEQDLMLNVSVAYFGVLHAVAEERVARTQKTLVKGILDQAEASLGVGSGDIIDVREARARFDSADSSLVSAENHVQIAKQRLERFTHHPAGTLNDLGPLTPEGPKPDQIEPWIQAALDYQPQLIKAREQLQIAKDGVEIAERTRWPRINLGGGYSYQKGGFLPSVETGQAQVGLNVSVPIFTSGEISARVRQAEAQARASEHQVNDIEDQVKLNTQTAFLNLRDSTAKFQAARSALESSGISLDATRKGFDVGTRTIVDVLNAVRDHASAERDYHAARYNQVMARIELKAAAGILSIKDLEAVNSLLVVAGGEGSPEPSARE
jgi:outer membrane protein